MPMSWSWLVMVWEVARISVFHTSGSVAMLGGTEDFRLLMRQSLIHAERAQTILIHTGDTSLLAPAVSIDADCS